MRKFKLLVRTHFRRREEADVDDICEVVAFSACMCEMILVRFFGILLCFLACVRNALHDALLELGNMRILNLVLGCGGIERCSG